MVYVESNRWIMLYRGGPPTPGTSVPVMPKIHRRLRAAEGGEGMGLLVHDPAKTYSKATHQVVITPWWASEP